MNTISAVLDPDADGTLHLPLPVELRGSKVKVTATLEAATEKNERPTRESALAALRRLRTLGTFQTISDPAAWQREIRRERELPGRG